MQINDGIEENQEEVLVIVVTHAVVDPWTMVVHPQRTFSASSTMMAAVRFEATAPFAVSPFTIFPFDLDAFDLVALRILQKREIVIIHRNLSWIGNDGTNVTNQQKDGDYLKDDNLQDATSPHVCILILLR